MPDVLRDAVPFHTGGKKSSMVFVEAPKVGIEPPYDYGFICMCIYIYIDIYIYR